MIFLGTGAAEAMPNPFCNCDVCRKARESGDPREIRGRTAFSIDEHNLIDFGPDAHMAANRFGVPLYDLHNIFYTHTHTDHFSVVNWESIRMSLTPPHIRVYMTEAALEGFREYRKGITKLLMGQEKDFRFYDQMIDLTPVKPYESFETDGMTVTPLHARHFGDFPNESGVNYLFERNGKRFLYASDTGLYCEENYEALKGKSLNILVMECSFGNTHQDMEFKHLTCESVQQMVERFRKDNVVTDRTEIYLTHIGHKGGMNHIELQQKMRDMVGPQIDVAYDGLRLADF